jgi:hypothetical protein
VNAGVPQGSLLSPILFLFYNVELLEIYNRSRVRIARIGFVDDINILAYSPSIDSNCQQLERIYKRCLA